MGNAVLTRASARAGRDTSRSCVERSRTSVSQSYETAPCPQADPATGTSPRLPSRDPLSALRAADQAHAGGQGSIGADWSCDVQPSQEIRHVKGPATLARHAAGALARKAPQPP